MLQPDERQRVDAYLSGQMSPEEATAFEDALLLDESLLAAFEAYAQSQESTHVPNAPAHFAEDVRERIRRRSGGRLFQEDPVTKRYLPIFVVVAVAILIVFVVVGRHAWTPGIDERSSVLDQKDASSPDESRDDATENDARGRRVTDRSNRRLITEEELMRPASAGRSYKDLPLATGRMPSKVTYTRRVTMLKSAKSADALRKEIEKTFPEKDIEQQEGYWRMPVDPSEIGEVYQRLATMSGTVLDDSAQVPQEEAEKRYLRFYYDVPKEK